MNHSKCLGLLGGLGVAATIHYYRELAAAIGPTFDVIISNAHPTFVYKFLEAGDASGLAEYLAAFIRRLQAAGAELAVIPAVTPHDCLNELLKVSPVPLIDIFTPLRAELAAKGIKRVAIFGTRFVIESQMYNHLGTVEIVKPSPVELDAIHATYTVLANTGQGTVEHYDLLSSLASLYISRDHADAILFAGTDLSVLFNSSNISFPHVDCATLHIRAIAQSLRS